MRTFSKDMGVSKEVHFDETKCTIYKTGYFCEGKLTDENREKLKEIQEELKNQ